MYQLPAALSPSISLHSVFLQSFVASLGTWSALLVVMLPTQAVIIPQIRKLWERFRSRGVTIVNKDEHK